MTYKPMLARDWLENKVKFPCIIQPKIDGVRAINRNGKLLGRSLKPHENRHVTELFSRIAFHGFDGEMIIGTNDAAPDLCRMTSGAMRRRDSVDNYTWFVFDYLTEDTEGLPYVQRMHELERYVDSFRNQDIFRDIQIIHSTEVNSIEELNAIDDEHLNLGYEGSIIRATDSIYKHGRSDGKMQVWRIKRFIDAEFLIEKIVEGQHNANEAKTNELGRTERSTHQENMHPNGVVGSFEGSLLADVLDPQTNAVIIPKGTYITVSPGNMDHAMRKYAFENQHEYLQQIGKFKLFPKGTKEKPRFPTFISLRSKEDMS